MRYCISKAIQDATIDETNVELKVTCGRKVVTLKSSDEEACNLRIEVAIQCDEGEVIDVARLIQYGLNIGSDPEVRTYEEGSKRCSKCIEDETPNPDNSEGLCRHNFNPCLGCGKQILETQSWDQFKTVPKVLIIPINRLVYDTETVSYTHLTLPTKRIV